MHFLHFPPLFMRFLTRVGGSVEYQVPPETDDPTAPYNRVPNFDGGDEGERVNGYRNAEGLRGPADHDFRLFDEKRIDDLLRNVPNIATAERCIPLNQFPCPASLQATRPARDKIAQREDER